MKTISVSNKCKDNTNFNNIIMTLSPNLELLFYHKTREKVLKCNSKNEENCKGKCSRLSKKQQTFIRVTSSSLFLAQRFQYGTRMFYRIFLKLNWVLLINKLTAHRRKHSRLLQLFKKLKISWE